LERTLAYSPLWESLSEALKRIVLSGIGKTTAKDQLARAIADAQVKVRILVDPSYPEVGGRWLDGKRLAVPEELSSKDLDWELSRPFEHWETGPGNVEQYEGTWGWQARRVQRLQVSTSDVNMIWCSGGEPRVADVEPTDVDTTAEKANRLAAPALASRERLAIPNKPGGGRKKTAAATEAMVHAVKSGHLTFQDLQRMKQKQLPGLYPNAGRTTLEQAREEALQQLAADGNSDKAPT
jgi:hypothetical protein